MSAHPELEQLERFRVDGAPDGAPDVAAHVAECARCRETLVALQEQAALAQELRALGADPLRGAPSPQPPLVVGYDSLRLISSGGQGVVWRARQSSTQRDVALKVLIGAQFASPRTRARFEREIELAAALDHPHLVTVFDSGTTGDGLRWLAMQYIEGAPFVAWARPAAGRARSAVLGTFIALCRAVDAAHRRGVLHRDLKSSNVLVDAAGAPHVLDFGLAAVWGELSAAEGAERLTQTGEFMGTLAYASPEHISGDPARIDIRSDVYSLGVLLFEALTGQLPHDQRGSTWTVAHRIQSTPAATQPLEELPVDLATVIRHALATDPDRRYSSCAAFADDIERFCEGRAVEARRDSALYVLRKTLVRYKWRVAAAAAAVLLVALSAVLAFVLLQRSERFRIGAQAEAARANELSDFWRSLFDALDPELVAGRDVSVRSVLDDAAARIDERRARSPRAELELRTMVGRAYHKIGLDRFAWPHLVAAQAIALRELGDDDPRTASLWSDAATVTLLGAPRAEIERLMSAPRPAGVASYRYELLRASYELLCGEPSRADETLRRARQMLATDETERDPLGAIGVLLESSRQARERDESLLAIEFAREAAAFAAALGGGRSASALRARFEAGLAQHAAGDIAHASRSVTECAVEAKSLLGERHPTALHMAATATLLRAWDEGYGVVRGELQSWSERARWIEEQGSNQGVGTLTILAELALGAGDLLEAERYTLAADGLVQRLAAQTSARSSRPYALLARCALERGAAAEALVHCDAGLGAEAQGVARNGDNFALRVTRAGALARSGRLAEAELEAQAALKALEPPQSAGPLRWTSAARTLAFVQALGGRLSEAQGTLRGALRSLGGAASSEVAALSSDLGDVLIQSGELAEAETLLRSALAIRLTRLGDEHVETATTQNLLGTALFFQRKGPPDLPGLWLDALRTLERDGVERQVLASVLNNLGAYAQVVEGDAERAEALLRRGLAVAERTFEAGHPLLAPSLANVAALDLAAGEIPQARDRLQRSLAILLTRHGEDHPNVVQVRRMLAACEGR